MEVGSLEEHAFYLGCLVGNFQSLEILLRMFLTSLPDARPHGLPHGEDMFLYPVGTSLPLNDITSYDALDKLIRKFNVVAARQGLPEIDISLVEVRDALAHGRVSATAQGETLRLVKFTRPISGQVTVAFNVEMSKEWLGNQRRRVYEAMQIVVARLPSSMVPARNAQ
jgi:hypothetical protein